MRYQKTLLSFDVNVYTAQSTLTCRRSATKRGSALLRRTASKHFSLEIYVRAIKRCELQPQQKLEAATLANDSATKARNTRENDHGNVSQTSSHLLQRFSHAHPQIALGGIGGESGTAGKGLGAVRAHRQGSPDTK
jgi:hypothetical protein